jgi:hypothetical protein
VAGLPNPDCAHGGATDSRKFRPAGVLPGLFLAPDLLDPGVHGVAKDAETVRQGKDWLIKTGPGDGFSLPALRVPA